MFEPDVTDVNGIGAIGGLGLEPAPGAIPLTGTNDPLTGGMSPEVLAVPTLGAENYDATVWPLDSVANGPPPDEDDGPIEGSPSSVDPLMGLVANGQGEPSISGLMDEAVEKVHSSLQELAAGPDLAEKLTEAFGENGSKKAVEEVTPDWLTGNFSGLPELKVVSSAEIDEANGAYAEATDTIYISGEFLVENIGSPQAVADVLLEEIGHHVDARVNVFDTEGDEGEIFSAVVQGKELGQPQIEILRGEDDTAVVVIDGLPTFVEQSSEWTTLVGDSSSGTFEWLEQISLNSDRDNGISVDFGDGSPGEGLPSDRFTIGTYTETSLQAGQDYKFKARADDYFQLFISSDEGRSWNRITNGWQQAYEEPEEYYFTPSSDGQHFVWAYMYENTGNAYLDISWEDTGFSVIESARGVRLLGDQNGNYLQVVDLSEGASVKLRTTENSGDSFVRESIESAWNSFSEDESSAFSISNGAFFDDSNPDKSQPVGIAFPIKIDSTVYEGYGMNENPDRKLEIWNRDNSDISFIGSPEIGRAEITDYDNNPDSIRSSSAPIAIVGLNEGYNKGPSQLIPRTFVGVSDRDGNGESETILILNSEASTQPEAAEILRDFGAEEVMMLDGGGSTQMITKGQAYVESPRTIPQTIGVTSAPFTQFTF